MDSHFKIPPDMNSSFDEEKYPNRLIRAEDQTWMSNMPDLLKDQCISLLASEYPNVPRLEKLSLEDREKFVNELPLDMLLNDAFEHIPDEKYWERRFATVWPRLTKRDQNQSWKGRFIEQHLAELIKNYDPGESFPSSIENFLPLCSNFVRNLSVNQFYPMRQASEEEEWEDGTDEPIDYCPLDILTILKALPQLITFSIQLGVENCGTQFRWGLFAFQKDDFINLGEGIKSCRQLKNLSIHRSGLTDEAVFTILNRIGNHASLTNLNLSNNKIGGEGVSQLFSWIKTSVVTHLNLANNRIGDSGAKFIAEYLEKSDFQLRELNLKLNRISDVGGRDLCSALDDNRQLMNLNLRGNDFTSALCDNIRLMLIANQTLLYLNLSCNDFKTSDSDLLEKGLEENDTLLHLDIRLSTNNPELETRIANKLEANQKTNDKLTSRDNFCVLFNE